MDRVVIRWTSTAREGLARLPRKVRRGLLDKANELKNASDASKLHKPLIGPLAGYHRITYSRYRAIYKVEREVLSDGNVVQTIYVLFIAGGIRKEGDKKDIYRFARKLVEMGLIPDPTEAHHELEKEQPPTEKD